MISRWDDDMSHFNIRLRRRVVNDRVDVDGSLDAASSLVWHLGIAVDLLFVFVIAILLDVETIEEFFDSLVYSTRHVSMGY